jgi:hypothetical protein
MDKIIYFLGVIAVVLISVQCGSRYNNTKFDDVNVKNSYVYGTPDDVPKQTLNKYPKDSVAEARAVKLREKMFGEGDIQKGN